MRILLVTVEYPPRTGGISSHVSEIYKALLMKGHRCTVVAPASLMSGDPNRRALGAGTSRQSRLDTPGVVRPKVISAQPFYSWMLRGVIRRLVASAEFDVVHVHGLRPLSASHGHGVPVVFTNHSSGFLERLADRDGRLARAARVIAPASGVIAVSSELGEATRAAGYRGPVAVIPNGVDPERFTPGFSKMRYEWAASDRDVVLLLPRRLVEKNGVVWFARALTMLGPGNWRAVIAGAGPEEAAMREVLAVAGLQDRCVFLGSVPQSDMPEVYRAADIVMLPSLAEATSIAGLEAMASGRPVIGTTVGGIPEIVSADQTGLLVPPRSPEAMAHAMRRLIEERDLSRRLGAAGRTTVEERFSWATIARRTTEFLQECIDRRASVGGI